MITKSQNQEHVVYNYYYIDTPIHDSYPQPSSSLAPQGEIRRHIQRKPIRSQSSLIVHQKAKYIKPILFIIHIQHGSIRSFPSWGE